MNRRPQAGLAVNRYNTYILFDQSLSNSHHYGLDISFNMTGSPAPPIVSYPSLTCYANSLPQHIVIVSFFFRDFVLLKSRIIVLQGTVMDRISPQSSHTYIHTIFPNTHNKESCTMRTKVYHHHSEGNNPLFNSFPLLCSVDLFLTSKTMQKSDY